jgi:Fe2+ transport system protein FeoA
MKSWFSWKSKETKREKLTDAVRDASRAQIAEAVPLSALKVGQGGSICQLRAEGALRRRLLDMGVLPGDSVRIERCAPLGDPLELSVKGYHLSLRKAEASLILVTPLADLP